MPGGNFLAQNKVRPGAYLNFKSVPTPMMKVGDRGIATIAMPLSWGKEGSFIDVYSEEMQGNGSIAKVGFNAFDSESKLLNIMLQYCYQAKVYRLDAGGTKASASIGDLDVEAVYNGTFGNKITISVVAEGTLYKVSTFVNGVEKDVQKVATIAELEENDFVTFSTEAEEPEFTATAGTLLSGGTNGTATLSTGYSAYLDLLNTAKFQTACFDKLGDSESTLKATVTAFIKRLRDEEGRYVQGVIANYPQANHEGIISNTNGCVINDVEFTKEELCACIAGMTAGANINESNTNKVIIGATKIKGELTDAQIKTALNNGQLVLSARQNGDIKIEKDINSYHTFVPEKNYSFSKNRVVRTLDEIGTTIEGTWEVSYMGKVDNDENGRGMFKSDVDNYMKTLEGLHAIQDYVSSGGIDNLKVEQGDDIDAVVMDAYIKPVDSMEFLYATFTIRN